MSERSKYGFKNIILRIAKDEWFRQVFTIKKYYPGVAGHWESGGPNFSG